MSDHLVDFELCYRSESDAAWLLAEHEKGPASWFPKSCAEISQEGPYGLNQVVDVTLPQWLAEREGLV